MSESVDGAAAVTYTSYAELLLFASAGDKFCLYLRVDLFSGNALSGSSVANGGFPVRGGFR